MNQPAEHQLETDPVLQSESSLTSLIKRLADQIAHLFATEIDLARAELKQAAADARAGALSLGAGAIVLLVGLIGLMAAAILGLSQVMEPWLAALVVGGAITIVGLIMVMAGKKKLEPSAFAPQRTGDQLREDARLAKRTVT
jgi:uncharacterized membrane protein YqjE